MTRSSRYHPAPVFTQAGDFNEQLYVAVRKSPWWMLSLAIHALVFAIAGLVPTAQPPPAAPPQAKVVVGKSEPPPEVDPPKAPDDVKSPVPASLPDPEPAMEPVKDPTPENKDDNDLPDNSTYGDTQIDTGTMFEGVANNKLVGIGGSMGAFGGRGTGGHGDARYSPCGGARVCDTVEDSLAWLAAHQSPDGGWEGAGFDRWCDGRPADAEHRPGGLGKPMYDPGVTGLALCTFLGAGYAPRGDHRFARVVRNGLRYLKAIQDPEGCFGPKTTQHFIYNHATAALAMVEAYGMTGSPIYKDAAQRGLDFITIARNPYFAWRYGVKPGDNDTSVTGWMMMALKSARLVNEEAKSRGKEEPLQIDLEAFQGIRSWLDKMTDPDYGRVGYTTQGSPPARPQDLVDRFPSDRSESMTAVGVLARIFIGEDPRKSAVIGKGVKLLTDRLPVWNTTDGSIDMYYWYYATLAMFQVGGEPWKKWNAAMLNSIVANQRKDGDFCLYRGSWDPIDPWGGDGGRVYSTSLLAMCLEVYYRYDRVVGTR